MNLGSEHASTKVLFHKLESFWFAVCNLNIFSLLTEDQAQLVATMNIRIFLKGMVVIILVWVDN